MCRSPRLPRCPSCPPIRSGWSSCLAVFWRRGAASDSHSARRTFTPRSARRKNVSCPWRFPYSRHFRKLATATAMPKRTGSNVMFLDFYQLREQPFGVTPDPRYLYLSSTHKEALASLYYGIEAGRGFLALIAKPGIGKTTLLFQLLERLEGSARTIFLFQTQCDLREFFRYLLADLGVDTSGLDLVQMHEKLNEILIREARAKRRFVLVIDEAQNLEDTVLESVRLLSDFETPSAKLMQIVLAGQPQLAEKLARPELIQLRKRISIVSRLQPLTPEETSQYIEHRLRVAGLGGKPFRRGAPARIEDRYECATPHINNLSISARI